MPNDARETAHLSQTAQRSGPLDPRAVAEGDVLLGRFKLVRLLGRGGMGEVYEARDLRLHVTVALKTVRASFDNSPEHLERLRREVQLARSVSHPNVCRVFDFHEGLGPNEKPLTFVTMEFLEGETLAERLQSGHFTPRHALPLLRQMADGLAAIHAKSLVHRDFKPGNVMLVPEPDGQRAVVTDFGIARHVGPPGVTGWEGTAEGAVVGSPAYMAPEQQAGAEVTTRADVFALGLVACEMTSGHLPAGGSLGQVPRTWARPLAQALDPDPSRRYQNPLQLTAALERPLVPRLRWLALGLLLLSLPVGGVLVLRNRKSAPPANADRHTIAVLPLTNLSGHGDDDYFGDGLAEDILTQLAKVRGLHVISRTSTLAFRGTKVPLRQVAMELGAGLVLEGSVRRTGGRVRVTTQLIDARTDEHVWAETYDRDARDILDVQTDVASKVAAALALQLTQSESERLRRGSTTNPDAYDYYLRGLSKAGVWTDFDPAIVDFEKAVALDPTYARAHAQLALAYTRKGSEAAPNDTTWMERAEAELKRASELEPDLALAHFARAELAFTPYGGWDYQAALQDLETAEALEPGVAQEPLGAILAHVGLGDRGVQAAELAFKFDPINESSKNLVVFVYELSGRWREAVERARALFPQPTAGRHVCSSLLRLGRLDEAERSCPAGDNLFRATLLALRGKHADAKALLDTIHEEADDAKTRSYHHYTYARACLEALLGNKDEAVRLLRLTATKGMPNTLLFSRDPLLESIRSDPAFEKLMAELQRTSQQQLQPFR